LALVAGHPEWPAWVRLGAITGFMGGLTTFSTFSAETVAMLERGAYGSALGYAGLSLAGSLVLTAAGIATAHLLR
ncbi:fluoride efflux transporter FluC, partial [Achromobacter marplatensis]